MALSTLLVALLALECPSVHETPQGIGGQWITADGGALLVLDEKPAEITVTLRAVAPPSHLGDLTPSRDNQNPNPRLRDRSLAGLLLGRLRAAKAGWRGHLYDPRSGRSYRVRVTRVAPHVLKIRGYVGLRVLGRTTEWLRRCHYETRVRALLAAGDET